MKSVILLIVLISSITLAQVIREKCQKHAYNYQNLVLTWPGTFCLTKNCQSSFYKNWNKKTFTIHGLWPSSTEDGFLACVSNIDPFCNTPFNFVSLQTQIANQLAKVMVAYKIEPQVNFWRYEWSKHGVCYLNLTKKAGCRLTNAQIQNKYFQTMVLVYNQVSSKFQISRQIYNSKAQLGKALNFVRNQVILICDRKNNLLQLRICLSLVNNNPGDEKLITCPRNEYYTSNECKQGKIYLPTKIN